MIPALLVMALAAEIVGGGLLIVEIEQRTFWGSLAAGLLLRGVIAGTVFLLMIQWL